jgi:hypothetical protein
MTKEEYVKNNNDLGYLLYEYYKEKFDDHKHKPLLTQTQLITFLPMWGDMGTIMKMVIKYYAEKFK